MTAVVYCTIILTITSWSCGYGLEYDEDACRSLYYHCQRVSYQDCIQSEDFHFCSQDDSFLRDIISSRRSEVKNRRNLVDSEHSWPHATNNDERPRGSKEKFGRSEPQRTEQERYDTEDQSLRDSGDDLVHIIERLYKDRKESPAKIKEFHRISRNDDLELSRKREMLASSPNRRKQVERRDNSADRDLRIQFTYSDPEDGDERRRLSAEENDNYGEFASYVSGLRDSDSPHRQDTVAAERRKEEKSDSDTYGLGHILRNPLFSSEHHLGNSAGRISNLDRITNVELRRDRGKEPLDGDSKGRSHEGTRGSLGGNAFQDTRVPSFLAGQKQQYPIAAKHKKKDLIFVEVEGNDDIHIIAKSEDQANTDQDQGHIVLHVKEGLNNTAARAFANKLQNILWGIKSTEHAVFPQLSSHNNIITLHMVTNSAWFKANENARDVAKQLNTDKALRAKIAKETGIEIESADSRGAAVYHHPVDANLADWDQFALVTAIVGGCTLGIIAAAVVVCCIKRRRRKGSLVDLKKQEAIADYQELLRTQMSINSSDTPRGLKATYDQERHGLVNGQGKVMRRTWGEEPQRYNMNISTGHVVLAYMEDHLKNEDRLNKEWEVLCCYEADPKDTIAGSDPINARKNRYADVLPFDHSRVKLKETANLLHSDYVNANFITDVDPHNPAYIATQGPLENTVADFWQMVWEQGVVVVVNLTRLSDMGMSQCYRYWPEDGSEVYHIYEVHLISEHIWCDDYLVRSFYLKNIQTAETRTVTQFHFLTWPDLSVPDSPKALLEFRRKVNKCYRGQSCPIIVHCNDGVGRTGTYILVDLVLNSMMKGAKEIDIAATLEHLRDQRPDMVKAKAQFEFALAAVAEEVTAILTSLPS